MGGGAMISLEIGGKWFRFDLVRNVNILRITIYRDKNHTYEEGKIEMVVGKVELANLHDLIKKKLRLKP